MFLFFAIYVLSAIIVGIILSKEWRRAGQLGYKFSTKSYVAALALILIPLVNFVFLFLLIAEKVSHN